ncbi:MAG TPA: SGNH/GDSL hydrolase family protein [Polyangia bacterium]|nr:SGNH/GDSL hydrolase family protein [Polyangia bacterium]
MAWLAACSSSGSGNGGTDAGGGAGGADATGSTSATGSGGSSIGGGPGTGGAHAGGASGKGGTGAGQGGAGTSGGTAGSIGAAGTSGAAGTTGAAGTGGPVGGAGVTHWVGTWAASPYYDSGNQPPASLSNGVLRQIAHVSIGGSQLRVQFSNLFGNGSATIKSAHIAICKATPLVDSTIDITTDTALAFSGTGSVTIAQGKEVWSDPVSFTVAPLGNVTITTAFGTVSSDVTGHSGSRTTSYIQTGSSTVTATSMTAATSTEHWYFISGIDVMAPASSKAIVAIGDSITDGRGVDINKNDRWTDDLSARLQAMGTTSNVGMLNQGIGATNLVGTGTAAQARFSRDVLGQSGVRYVIVFDGVNDIGGGASFASMKPVYDSMISQAHAQGLLIYGATITPFGANSYYTAAHEAVRQQVNTYIKSGVFDGVLDFDAAVTDGGNPPKLQTPYATWTSADGSTDGLHPSPAGYQKMADSIDLTLFTK